MFVAARVVMPSSIIPPQFHVSIDASPLGFRIIAASEDNLPGKHGNDFLSIRA